MNPSEPQAEGALAGCRIGFVTTVVGMGGSEVLVADAIEAASLAGASVMCWCEPDAAIRRIVASRGNRCSVEMLNWPPDAPRVEAHADGSVTASTPLVSNRSLVDRGKRILKGVTPDVLKQVLGFLRDALRFRRELLRHRPDLILVNVNGSEAVSVGVALHRRKRLINCYHLSVSRSSCQMVARGVDWLLKCVTMWSGAIALHTSQAARDQWCQLCLYPRALTAIIYNGVDDLGTGSIAGKRHELGIAEDAFVFCVPGRLHPMKGHHYLLEAIALVSHELPNVEVLICGDGYLENELKREVDRLHLGRIVRFLGWRADVQDVLRCSNCCVLPSIESENLSVAVLEGLTAGIPAVVTNVGGMAEAVLDGRTGIVVSPRSASELSTAILRMAHDPVWARGLGAEARRDAMRRFSRARMMDEYVALFSSAAIAIGTKPSRIA